jgi:hypothetical protein
VPLVNNHLIRTIFDCVEPIEVGKQWFDNIYIHVECKHLPYLHPMFYFDHRFHFIPKIGALMVDKARSNVPTWIRSCP